MFLTYIFQQKHLKFTFVYGIGIQKYNVGFATMKQGQNDNLNKLKYIFYMSFCIKPSVPDIAISGVS